MKIRSISAALALASVLTFGQAARKSYTFHGKVEAIDKNAKNLRINGEKVEGWMDAMTMNYKVDDPSVLDKAKPGDQITATVYDGDEVLHKVQIVKKTDSKK
jgi:Cu/Ag efflux protein CusF